MCEKSKFLTGIHAEANAYDVCLIKITDKFNILIFLLELGLTVGHYIYVNKLLLVHLSEILEHRRQKRCYRNPWQLFVLSVRIHREYTCMGNVLSYNWPPLAHLVV